MHVHILDKFSLIDVLPWAYKSIKEITGYWILYHKSTIKILEKPNTSDVVVLISNTILIVLNKEILTTVDYITIVEFCYCFTSPLGKRTHVFFWVVLLETHYLNYPLWPLIPVIVWFWLLLWRVFPEDPCVCLAV